MKNPTFISTGALIVCNETGQRFEVRPDLCCNGDWNVRVEGGSLCTRPTRAAAMQAVETYARWTLTYL